MKDGKVTREIDRLMHIVSVNAASPRTIEFRGKSHQTGIFKRSIAAPLTLSRSGVGGDTVCDLLNHGGEHKAVYAFSQSHYPYWREVLGRAELPAGSFGENLTVSELNESEICIGDRLLVGSATLEVSQPRVPCFKLGVALGDDRAPALFNRHLHTGVYFRVLEEGHVRAGDVMQFAQRHPAAISVHALFRSQFDRSFEDAARVLEAASEIAELAPEWQEKVAAGLARRS